MARAVLGVKWLPMGNDAATLAAHIPQSSIAPDVAFRVLRMPLDSNCPKLIIGPYSSRAPAQRAVANRGLVGRSRQHEAHRSAVAGTFQRWCWLFVVHRGVPLFVVPPNVGGNRRAAPTLAKKKACAGASG